MNLLKKLLFPPKCAACHTLLNWYETQEADVLCPVCLDEWARAKAVTCEICGKPVIRCACLPDELQKAKCKSFRKLTYYHGGRRDCVQNRVIFRIKESRDMRIMKFLARELTVAVKDSIDPNRETILTYTPRGRAAKLEYGTDQAQRLAKELSHACGLSCVPMLQRSRRHDPEQKDLSPTARKKNAKTAFSLLQNRDVKGKHVILVDDIVTTGNTLAAGARLLYRAGAASVCCIAVSSDDVNREMI